ncbi:MAG: glycosyltransferase [Actinomycetota bacterium]
MSTLLVASTGGHLKELFSLRERFSGSLSEDTWVTFDSPQSRSLLQDQKVIFARNQPPRDYRSCAANTAFAARLLSRQRYDRVISTGAGVALAFLPVAASRGIPCHYIESATRVTGPSLTGRILRRWPGIDLYTQSRRWSDRAWNYRGSIFDGFEVDSNETAALGKAVVTLGTQAGYPFGRMVLALEPILLGAGAQTLWQTGDTPPCDARVQAVASVPHRDLERAMIEADVVVSHAGIGSALAALEAGKCPVLVPRRAEFREHVDDHQHQIAADLAARGLAIACEAGDLTREVLCQAASRKIIRKAGPPVFELHTGQQRVGTSKDRLAQATEYR